MQYFSRLLHCTFALLLFAPSAWAQQGAPAANAYTTFLRGTPVGREDVRVRSDDSGVTVTSEGRVSVPVNLTIQRAQFTYAPDWSPQLFELSGNANGAIVSVRTTFAGGNAVTITNNQQQPITQPISPQAMLHANGVVASYAGLARRLGSIAQGGQFRMYIVPEGEIDARLVDVQVERLQLGAQFLGARRYELVLSNEISTMSVTVMTGVDGGLLSVRIPSQNLDIVRADLASSTTRMQVHSNPGDEPVTIPATGFNLGATLTRPKSAAAGTPLPAVILVGGSGTEDREGYVSGIPMIGQLAGALADAGVVAVRFDRRGYAQSGGRAESATIVDAAEDVRTIMRWLADRKDIDPKRIAVVGHGDGAWVALLAAARERRFAAVATLAGPAGTGAELILERQQTMLAQSTLSPEEQARRVALQKQINAAVKSGKGLAELPADVRTQADTLWFQSLLNFDAAKVLKDVRQPLLIVHGALDKQLAVTHADRLAQLANKESDSKAIEVVVVKGVNHLLVPAFTGEMREYGELKDRNVSKEVVSPLAAWLTRTFAAIK